MDGTYLTQQHTDGSSMIPIEPGQLDALNEYLVLKSKEKDLLEGSPELRKLIRTLQTYAPDLIKI